MLCNDDAVLNICFKVCKLEMECMQNIVPIMTKLRKVIEKDNELNMVAFRLKRMTFIDDVI